MTSFERLTNRLKGLAVDKVPNLNIYMTYAAQSINQPLSKYYLDYKILVDANIAMVEQFDVDILQAISDPYRETYDFGANIEFPHNGLPKNKTLLLDDHNQINKLQKPKPDEGKRMSDRLEAIRLMREKAKNEIPVMGWVEGPLAQAGNLRGISNIMMDLLERPEWVKDLLEIITEVEIEFALAQIKAGADIIGLGDAIASQISPELYIEFALPYEKRIFEAVKNSGAIARLHICGDTNLIVKNMVKSGAQIVDLDWMVNINEAEDLFGDQIVFCGNLDPVQTFLNGTSDNVYKVTKEILSNTNSRIICAGGCEIPLDTPHYNLIAHNSALMM